MEPRIQYATAPDGVNLAFWSRGDGVPLVHMSSLGLVFGNIQTDWLSPQTRTAYESLAKRMRVVGYDSRGRGFSDRDPPDDSLEAHIGDLLAIINRLSLDRVVLYARVYAGPVAIAFTHRYPERVSHLVLHRTAACLADYLAIPRLQAVHSLLEKDWELYTEVLTRLIVGWSEHEAATRLVAQVQASRTPEDAQATLKVVRTWDVSDLLREILTPTLVLHTEAPIHADERSARALAAQIPHAQLRILEQSTGDSLAQTIYEFVSGEKTPERTDAVLPTGTAVILFADIVDSTALTEQLGDDAFRARSARLDAALRSGIRECGGTPIEGKVMGDGVMAVFDAARKAIDAAFRCRATADGTGLALHLGIHAGDVTREGENFYGGAVNVASRICDLSAPDEILVSATVRDLARTSAGAAFDDRGDHALKGISDLVRIYAVRPGGG